MHSTTIQTCSLKKHTFDILGNLKIEIEITDNPFQLPLDALFLMAARINKKRSFLFVSKILGKHIPVKPSTSMLGGTVLGLRFLRTVYGYPYPAQLPMIIEGLRNPSKAGEAFFLINGQLSLPEKVKFIGFAETATALGHSMFAAFKENAEYIHTTREVLVDKSSIINFEEEHSHATSHRFYALDEGFLQGEEPIVLVDDEITTGKTALNIIQDIQSKFPRKRYIVASLLDWRSVEDERRFAILENELGITITTVSLIKGRIHLQDHNEVNGKYLYVNGSTEPNVCIEKVYIPNYIPKLFERVHFTSVDSSGKINKVPYLLESGRFGITSATQTYVDLKAKKVGEFLQTLRKHPSSRTLVLGSGEFMYLPMLIAHHMGENVLYHSTTRSPIYPCQKEGYGAVNGYRFQNPEDPSITNYLYNVPFGAYDDLFLFLERDVPDERLETLKQAIASFGIPNVFLVICSSIQE
jgi:hypothetical protein